MEIAGMLATVTAAHELAKSVIGGKIDSAVKAKASELADSIIGLQGAIFTLQAKNHELLDKNRDLQEQLNGLHQWEATADNYELTEVCNGVLLYSLRKNATTEPHHYICPACYSNGHKSILSKSTKTTRGTDYSCAATDCGATYLDYKDRIKITSGRIGR